MSIAVTGFCCATDPWVDASTMASPSPMVVKYSCILCSPHWRAHPAAIVSRARLASSVAHALLHLGPDFVHREAGSLLPSRKSSERREEITNKLLDRDEHEGVIEHPVPVGIGRDRRALEWVRPQIVDVRETQAGKRLGPDLASPVLALLGKGGLPIVVS